MSLLSFIKRTFEAATVGPVDPRVGSRVELLVDPLDHIHELMALRLHWAVEDDDLLHLDDPFVDDFTEWMRREVAHRKFWIARVDDIAVGMVNLVVFDRMPSVGKAAGGWGYLCNMYIDQAHRNAGLGATLLTAVQDYADGEGLERVVLNPTERSRPFYRTLGFAPADQLLRRP